MFYTNSQGQLTKLLLNGYSVPMNTNLGSGPSYYIRNGGHVTSVQLAKVTENSFESIENQVYYRLTYKETTQEIAGQQSEILELTCTVENQRDTPFAPEICGLRLGVDSWMESYPSWNNKLFPTHMRCNATHFTGYMMSPLGDILALGSPDPIASWSLDYNKRGHRIRTVNLDLLNAEPLPSRHPKVCNTLALGESREWQIRLTTLQDFEQLPKALASLSEAPWVEMIDTTVKQGSPVRCVVHTSDAQAKDLQGVMITPSDKKLHISVEKGAFQLPSSQETGLYKLQIAGNNRITEASFYCRMPWSWYMEKAREAALQNYQQATTHCESLYGFYTLFRGEKILPNNELFKQAEERWNLIMPQLIDFETCTPSVVPGRIQNSATHINMLCDLFRITRNTKDLDAAIGLARWFIDGHQHADGAYRIDAWGSQEEGAHYTSVIYPAMNLMELYDLITEEERLGNRRDDRMRSYLYNSIEKAMNELEENRDDIDTEGEPTFEDGMISCSAAQLARFALMQSDTVRQERYTKAAEELLQKHKCLTQLLTPDARQRGATLRYWEARFDLITFPSMLNSPHGWSSWRSYALYYLYLLTGKADYLQQLMNVLGTCMQVVNHSTGELRWGFIADPYIRALELQEPIEGLKRDSFNQLDNYHLDPPKEKMKERIIGEEYLSMNSSWQYGNPNDNDVHEHFRCLSEVILTQAFVLETNEGIQCWNVTVQEEGDTLVLKPEENIVQRVHCSLLTERVVAGGEGKSMLLQRGWYYLKGGKQ